MSSPSSLRDLYGTSSTPWTFVPPPSPNGSSSAPPAAPSVSAPSYTFSSRPAPNSIFELSPGLTEPGGADVVLLLKTLVASTVLQYATTAIAMPWEVGKCLLQVQWVPRDAGDEPPEEDAAAAAAAEEELSDESGEDSESYFADPGSSARYPAQRPADEQGYVIRRSLLEESTQPEYIIPLGSADGVWGMIKRVGRFRSEGWLALWKGLLTACIAEFLSSTLQPLIHGALEATFAPASASPYAFPSQTSSLLLPVASQMITGFLLSPLDLVRTRLIVQSFTQRHRTYSGPLDALQKIAQDEGGLRGMYLHPHLLVPALLDSALRPLIAIALPPILAARVFGSAAISADTHPVTWGMVELASSCVGLLVSMPFETVRRRLQVQPRGRAVRMRTCVETRPAPYNGVVDALWHIVTEERSDLPIERRRGARRRDKGKRRESGVEERGREEVGEGGWWRSTGLGQLYHGFGLRVGASAIMVVLTVLSGGDEGEAGWAEL